MQFKHKTAAVHRNGNQLYACTHHWAIKQCGNACKSPEFYPRNRSHFSLEILQRIWLIWNHQSSCWEPFVTLGRRFKKRKRFPKLHEEHLIWDQYFWEHACKGTKLKGEFGLGETRFSCLRGLKIILQDIIKYQNQRNISFLWIKETRHRD